MGCLVAQISRDTNRNRISIEQARPTCDKALERQIIRGEVDSLRALLNWNLEVFFETEGCYRLLQFCRT